MREQHGLSPSVDVELAENIPGMDLNGSDRNAHPFRDLIVHPQQRVDAQSSPEARVPAVLAAPTSP